MLSDENVKVLVLGYMWGTKHRVQGREFEENLNEIKRLLELRSDVKLYILLDTPYSISFDEKKKSTDPLDHFYRINYSRDDFKVLVEDVSREWSDGNEYVKNLFGGMATFIDPNSLVCEGGLFDTLKWYKDVNHLHPKAAEHYAVWLDQVFE